LWETTQIFCFDKARPGIEALLYKNVNDYVPNGIFCKPPGPLIMHCAVFAKGHPHTSKYQSHDKTGNRVKEQSQLTKIFQTLITKVHLFQEHSCGILISFKVMILFNNTSADFVLISPEVLLKMIIILKERATKYLATVFLK
jgi:hypothetical protein